MRVLGDATKSTNFSNFALKQDVVTIPAAVTQKSTRLPDKEFMKQAKGLPTSAKVMATNKRRIVLSDDEDDEKPVLAKANNTVFENDDWLETRNPTTLSDFVREQNRKTALADRKNTAGKQAKIQKVLRIEEVNSNSEEEIEDTPVKHKPNMSKLLSKSNLIASSLLNSSHESDEGDELDPVEEVRRFKVQEKQLNRMKRIESREVDKKKVASKPVGAVDLTNDSEEGDAADSGNDDDSDSDDESESNRWRDDITKNELQEQAKKILRNCDNVSHSLRKSIKQWHGGDDDNTQQKDCVDLLRINEDNVDHVLHDEDIRVLCPGLQLKAYQLVGVNWMKLLHVNMVNGVLADDMGLGKTVQTIAFLGWLKASSESTLGSKKTKPHLIVVPASTLSNWQNELSRFCPSFSVVTYHGSQAERNKLRYELKGQIGSGEVDVLLSTYTIFERESGKSDRGFLYTLSFDYLILDEAHCIKNAESSRYQNLNGLKTRHRLLLSGTPVQNNLSELLAMLSFLMPNVFGRSNCELLIEAFGWTRSSSSSDNGSLSMIQLRGMLAPFVLRRLKRDVLDQLSDKINKLEKLGMTDFQRKVYDSILLGHTVRKNRKIAEFAAKDKTLDGLDKPAVAGSAAGQKTTKKKALSKAERELVDLIPPVKEKVIVTTDSADASADSQTVDLSVLDNSIEVAVSEENASELVNELSASEANHLFTALRKAANHPLLLRVRYKDDAVMERIAMVAYHQEHFGNQCNYDRVREEVDKFSDYDLHLLCLEYPDSLGGLELDASVLYDSPKMKYLRDMLPKLQAEGHRMLVFSQWTRLLDLLEVLLYDMKMSFLRLDGSTPVCERQELIDTYTTDDSIPVFLLSTKAGGLGINLTAADTVILHDLDFNPENDRQAEDRCHRIGQVKPVTVYKLVATETVDEDIYDMGERKRQLSHAVLSDERHTKSPAATTSSGKKGSSAATGAGTEPEDMNAIGKMLQRALARRTSALATLAEPAVHMAVVPPPTSPQPLRFELENVHLKG